MDAFVICWIADKKSKGFVITGSLLLTFLLFILLILINVAFTKGLKVFIETEQVVEKNEQTV